MGYVEVSPTHVKGIIHTVDLVAAILLQYEGWWRGGTSWGNTESSELPVNQAASANQTSQCFARKAYSGRPVLPTGYKSSPVPNKLYGFF